MYNQALDIIFWVAFVFAILSGVAGMFLLFKTKNVPGKLPITLIATAFVLCLIAALTFLLKSDMFQL